MKEKTMMSMVLVFAVLILGIVGAFTNWYGLGGQSASVVDSDGNIIIPTDGTCDITPSYTVKGYDIHNVGTVITEDFAYKKVGENSWTTGTLGTPITTLEPFAKYVAVAGIDASNGIDNPYGEEFSFTVPCLVGASMEVALYNDEVEGSVTGTFYNADSDASSETFIAGQTQDVSLKFQTGTDEAFGNAYLGNPNVLVLKLNSTEWDTPEKVYLADGTVLKSTSTPQRMEIESLTASGFAIYSFEAPAVVDTTTQIFLKLNADDSNAPAYDGVAYLFAGTNFITEDSSIEVGVETEEGADIGSSDPVSVALDFTA